jgi:hypothetical protein
MEVKMKGINFNTQEVKAILEGRKTVTRRVVKPQPKIIMQDKSNRLPMAFWIDNQKWIKPPYQKDDILYVKETWCSVTRLNDCEGKHSNFCGGIDSWEYYKADEDELPDGFKWHPSIHMSKEAARIFLKVTDVRVERLQDIDNAGIRAEGISIDCPEMLKFGIYGIAQSKSKTSANTVGTLSRGFGFMNLKGYLNQFFKFFYQFVQINPKALYQCRG